MLEELGFLILGEEVEHFPWSLGDRSCCCSCRVCWLPGIPLLKKKKKICISLKELLQANLFKAELAVFLFAIAAGLNTLTVSGCKYSTLSYDSLKHCI